MIHLIDFDGMIKDLFILEHFVYGTEKYIKKNKINYENYGSIFEFHDYKGLLKTHVTNTLINNATKLRIAMDYLRYDNEDEEFNLDKLDKECRTNLNIARFLDSKKENITIRNSCNKIIHATRIDAIWSDEKTTFDFWTGKYTLYGSYKKKKWTFELNIADWCTAMINFIEEINELIDWNSSFKYDS